MKHLQVLSVTHRQEGCQLFDFKGHHHSQNMVVLCGIFFQVYERPFITQQDVQDIPLM